jgi:hypothetical protein
VNAKTGKAETTLTSGDVIDGAGGIDSLTITSTADNNTSLSGVTIKNVENITYKGSDNLAEAGAEGSAAVAAGVAEIADYIVDAGAASGSAIGLKVYVGDILHTTTYAGNSTSATATSNKATAIRDVLKAVLGSTVSVSGSGGDVVLTAAEVGMALPAITVSAAEGTSGAYTDGELDIDTGSTSANTNTEVEAKTGAVAKQQIIGITIGEGSTSGFVGTNSFDVYVGGVKYGNVAATSSSTPATLATDVAKALSSVLGEGTATSLGAQVTVTAPVAGVALPHISVNGLDSASASADPGTATASFIRANQTVGAKAAGTATQEKIKAPATAESLTIDGTKTTVTGLTADQTLTFSGALASGYFEPAATATEMNLAVKGGSGTLSIGSGSALGSGPVLSTLNISGAMGVTKASKTAHTAAANKTLDIDDDTVGLGGADSITTINLAITTQGTITTGDVTNLEILNASASTGDLTISADTAELTQVWGGSGDDSITVEFDTDDLGLNDNPTTATVNAGAGDDTITVQGASGDGVTTLNGQDGDDTFVIASAVASSLLKVVGGAGNDLVYFVAGSTSLTVSEIAQIKLMDVENIALGVATTFDGEVLPGFGVIAMKTAASDVLNVTDSNVVSVVSDDSDNVDATVVHTDYIPKGYEDALATTRSGSLTIAISGGTPNNGAVVEAKAEAVTLSISAKNLSSDSLRVANVVQLQGDVETATVVLNSALDYRTGAGDTILSTIKVTPTDEVETISGAGDLLDNNTAFDELGALTSLTVIGVGNATIDNSDANTALANIDLSGLGGVRGAEAVSTGTGEVGDVLGASTITLGAGIAETIKLGSATDTIKIDGGSTVKDFDTIIGFDATKETATDNSTVDVLKVVSSGTTVILDGDAENEIAEVELTSGAINLDLAIIEAQAASEADSDAAVFFHFEGDTYVFKDEGTAGLANDDVLIKLSGIYQLDTDWAVYS